MDQSRQKIDAIYELRDAAEAKARAEAALTEVPSPEKKDHFLETQMTLEQKTVAAIAACHECGHAHPPGSEHSPSGGS